MKPFKLWLSYALAVFALTLPAFAQTTYYVDAELGNNSNDGTELSPWKTVDFALNGPHAPLAQGSTVSLMGTSGVTYSTDSDEVFPWVLNGDINLRKGPDGAGNQVIVDSDGEISVEYAPGVDVTSSTIHGLVFANDFGSTAISLVADGTTIFEPRVVHCFIDLKAPGSIGIELSTLTGAHSAARVVDCVVSAQEAGMRIQWVDPASANDYVESCQMIGDYAMILDGGTPASGTSIVESNHFNARIAGVWCHETDHAIQLENNQIQGFGGNATAGIHFEYSQWRPNTTVLSNTMNFFHTGIYVEVTDHLYFKFNIVEHCNHGMVVNSAEDLVLYDNTFTTLFGFTGHGLHVSERCRMENNNFDNEWRAIHIVDDYTGGLEIIDNNIRSQGDGIRLEGTHNAVIARNEIYQCIETAMFVNRAENVDIHSNRVFDNFGDGIYAANLQNGRILNNHVANNYSGMYITALAIAPPMIVHNTVCFNTIDGLNCADVSVFAPPYIGNNLLWGNGDGVQTLDLIGPEEGQYWSNLIGTGGVISNGNISADPLLSTGGEFFTLTAGSPCIDSAGMSWATLSTDAIGGARVVDGDWSGKAHPDMGAVEYSTTYIETVAESYEPGDLVTVTGRGPTGMTMDFYYARSMAAPPLNPVPMHTHELGTVLLDPAAMPTLTPFDSATLNSWGMCTGLLQLPSGTYALGAFVAIQAVCHDGLGASQVTNAWPFQIRWLD